MPKTNRKQRSLTEIQAILADYDSSSGDGIRRAWITKDGENWHPIQPQKAVVIQPVMSTNKSSTPTITLKIPTGRTPARRQLEIPSLGRSKCRWAHACSKC